MSTFTTTSSATTPTSSPGSSRQSLKTSKDLPSKSSTSSPNTATIARSHPIPQKKPLLQSPTMRIKIKSPLLPTPKSNLLPTKPIIEKPQRSFKCKKCTDIFNDSKSYRMHSLGVHGKVLPEGEYVKTDIPLKTEEEDTEVNSMDVEELKAEDKGNQLTSPSEKSIDVQEDKELKV